MVEFQPKYNLRSKSKPTSTTQPKKIIQRGQAYEPTSEETLLPNNKTKVVSTQESEVEKVETQAQGTKTVNKITSSTRTMSNKAVQMNKSERKDSEVSTKETNKVSGAFSFENEINKIKIPIPLVELAKNPVYRKQITKAMGVSELESQSDVLNLEDDKPNITFGPHFEGAKDTIAPFYITLNVYDQLLHNCMLDSEPPITLCLRLLWTNWVSRSPDLMETFTLLTQEGLSVWG
jgi:rRNA maturation endonuclease Nob1